MGGEHARAWDNRRDAEVVAVCDPDESRCRELAGKYGTAGYARWHDAIAHEGINVVSICSPVCFHRDLAVAAAEAGKHVLCEKPMALTLSDADDMIAAADANGVQLVVCHQYRGLGHFQVLKRLVDNDTLGTPLHVHMTDIREVRPKLAMHRRSMNGGPVHDMSGHFFDLARMLTGSQAVSVTAVGGTFGRGKERLAGIDDLGYDAAEIQVRFEGEHCLSININWGLPEGTPEFSQEIIAGPNGMVRTVGAHAGEFEDDDSPILKKAVIINNGDGNRRVANPDYPRGPAVCIADLMRSVRTGEPGEFDGRSGRKALALIVAALESIESGKTVYL